MFKNKKIIIVSGLVLFLAILTGCDSGNVSAASGNANNSNQYVLGTLSDGAKVVVESNSLTANVSQANKVMSKISILGGQKGNKYTIKLDEFDAGNLYIDSATQLKPSNCTIISGGSCTIVYPGFSGAVLHKKVKALVAINGQNTNILPKSIDVKITNIKSVPNSPAITAMISDNQGNIYFGDESGNVKTAFSQNSGINLNPVTSMESSTIVNMTNTQGTLFVTSRNNQIITSTVRLSDGTFINAALPIGESGTYFYAITADNNGSAYAAGWNESGGAIYKLGGLLNQWQNIFQVPKDPSNPRNSYVTAITANNVDGNLYFGTLGGDIYMSGLANPESATLLPALPDSTKTRITSLKAGVFVSTPLVVATYNNSLLALGKSSSGVYSWNTVFSPTTTPQLTSFIQAMKFEQDNTTTGTGMNCGILFFTQASSQQLWHTEICGQADQGYSSDLSAENFDINNMSATAQVTNIDIATNNNYVYAGATDGSISIKSNPAPVFETFSLIHQNSDGGYYECPGIFDNAQKMIGVYIDSDVPNYEHEDYLYSMSANITSDAPLFTAAPGMFGYIRIAGQIQTLFNDPTRQDYTMEASTNFYCTDNCSGGGYNGPPTFQYVSRFGSLVNNYTIYIAHTPNGQANNCTLKY